MDGAEVWCGMCSGELGWSGKRKLGSMYGVTLRAVWVSGCYGQAMRWPFRCEGNEI